MTAEALNEILDGSDLTKMADFVPENEIVNRPSLNREVPTKGEKALHSIVPHTYQAPSGTEDLDIRAIPRETDNTLVKQAIFQKLEEASGIDVASLASDDVLTKVAYEHVQAGEQLLYKEASAIAELMADVFMSKTGLSR